MTKKRFEYIRTKYRHYIQDVEKDGEYKKGYRGTYDEFDLEKLTNLLNELAEEKEMWKRECERLKGLYYFENEKDEHLAWKRVDVK